ncbi:MAG: hypothetical protein K2H13_09145 [Eubacterium sp.]|nr:hypothetical protein [Eubacterium sp.]MDE6156193.1 hypothetical protein [Eubacterium sp.]
MLYFKQGELLGVEDIFENDEFVLMKATYQRNSFKIAELSVGLKDDNGDIIRIIDVDTKVL